MASIFTRIYKGELPGNVVWEDKDHFALLTIQPVAHGHTLVVPKREVDHWLSQTPKETASLWQAVHTVGTLLQKVYKCHRVCQLVIGWEVPHLHVHLIPTVSADIVRMPPVLEVGKEDLAREAARIRSAHA